MDTASLDGAGGIAYPSDIFSAGAFLWFVVVSLLSVRLSQFGCLHLHNSFPKIGAWCDIGSRWNALSPQRLFPQRIVLTVKAPYSQFSTYTVKMNVGPELP